MALFASSPWAAEEEYPNFAGPIVTTKLRPASGTRKVLAILWDFGASNTTATPRPQIDRLLFAEEKSVAAWFRENSCGRFGIEKAGLLGWYTAEKPGSHYLEESAKRDPHDRDGDGWLNGHTEKWAEAIRCADREFDFALHDTNEDGVLSPNELGVFIVLSSSARPFGTIRPPRGREYPSHQPLVVDGVRIPLIAEWYTGLPANLGAAAHELAHLLVGMTDLYFTAPWPFEAGRYSLACDAYCSCHLDPFEKLKLGWLHPRVVTRSGRYELRDVESTGDCLLLYAPEHGPQEYFLLENRWRGTSFDAGVPPHGDGLPQDGLALWHILEDPKDFDATDMPTAHAGEWGRRGIRLVRANGGKPLDDRRALFSEKHATVGDDTVPAHLRWENGSPSGFQVELLTRPGRSVHVAVTVRR